MPDLTLRIDGEAEGAKRAAKETTQTVQGLGQAAGQASGPIAETGQAGETAGKGFDFGRREAARLAQTLAYATGIGGQFAGALTYLMQAALNPATLGFAAAVIAVQGLTAAFRASAAETEAEKRRMGELVRLYADAADNLQKYRRAFGEETDKGFKGARQRQLRVAAEARVAADVAREIMEAAPKEDVEILTEMARGWAGRPAEQEDLTPTGAANRWRRGRRRWEMLLWGEEAPGKEDPTARRERLKSLGAAEREAGITGEMLLAAELTDFLHIPEQEALSRLQQQRVRMERRRRFGLTESAPPSFLRGEQARKEHEEMTRFFAQYEGGEVEPGYRTIHYNYGMNVYQQFGGADRPGILSDGQPRGLAH